MYITTWGYPRLNLLSAQLHVTEDFLLGPKTFLRLAKASPAGACSNVTAQKFTMSTGSSTLIGSGHISAESIVLGEANIITHSVQVSSNYTFKYFSQENEQLFFHGNCLVSRLVSFHFAEQYLGIPKIMHDSGILTIDQPWFLSYVDSRSRSTIEKVTPLFSANEIVTLNEPFFERVNATILDIIDDLTKVSLDRDIPPPQLGACRFGSIFFTHYVRAPTCAAQTSNQISMNLLLAPLEKDESCPDDGCPGAPVPCGNSAWCVGGVCQCPSDGNGFGYFGFACEGVFCADNCNSRGFCIDPRSENDKEFPFCQCEEGWTGEDCSVGSCPNDCVDAEHGVCSTVETGPPRCICQAGWILGPNKDCSKPRQCPGEGANCSGNGQCNKDSGECECDFSWRGADCSLPDCPGSPDCTHRGKCTFNATAEAHICECAAGFTGDACEIAQCPQDCNGQGTCVASLSPPRCVCDPGFYGESCKSRVRVAHACLDSNFLPRDDICLGAGQMLSPIILNDPNIIWDSYFCGGLSGQECNNHGTCDRESNTCECRPGFVHGPLGQCEDAWCLNGTTDLCGEFGFCNTDLAQPQCECDPLVKGELCTILPCPGVFDEQTKTFAECSGRYACSGGVCQCPSYLGIDCSIGACAIGNNGFHCSNNGDCVFDGNLTWSCVCDESWEGEDCSKPICPLGENGEECSGNGVCREAAGENENECFCNRDFTGSVCQETNKGGDGDDTAIIIPIVVAILIVLCILIILIVIIIASVLFYKKQRTLKKQLQHVEPAL